MRKHDITGDAVFDKRPKTLHEKTNQTKQRKMIENSNIALVNMRKQIEHKKGERLGNNLHLVDFAKGNTHIHFVSSIDEIKNASIKTNIGDDEI